MTCAGLARAAVVGGLLSACQLAKGLDSCGSPGISVRVSQANANADQHFRNQNGMVRLPNGNGLAIFTSSPIKTEAGVATSVHAKYIEPTAFSVSDCNSASDYLLDPTTSSTEMISQDQGTLAAAADEQSHGLAVYGVQHAPLSNQAGPTWIEIKGSFFAGTGCFGTAANPAVPFAISGQEMDVRLIGLSAVTLGPDLFAVFWLVQANSTPVTQLRARLVRDDSVPGFPSSALSASGDSASFELESRWILSMATLGLPGGKIALFLQTRALYSGDTRVLLTDSDLSQISSEYVISNDEDQGSVISAKEVAAAQDGNHVVAAWVQSGSAGNAAIWARILSGDATPSAAHNAFQFSGAASASGPVVTGLHSGGFLLSWVVNTSSGLSIHAGALTSNGEYRATAWSCDSHDFSLLPSEQDWQGRHALAGQSNGSLFVSWNSRDAGGTNPVVIRSTVLSADDLFIQE